MTVLIIALLALAGFTFDKLSFDGVADSVRGFLWPAEYADLRMEEHDQGFLRISSQEWTRTKPYIFFRARNQGYRLCVVGEVPDNVELLAVTNQWDVYRIFNRSGHWISERIFAFNGDTVGTEDPRWPKGYDWYGQLKQFGLVKDRTHVLNGAVIPGEYGVTLHYWKVGMERPPAEAELLLDLAVKRPQHCLPGFPLLSEFDP